MIVPDVRQAVAAASRPSSAAAEGWPLEQRLRRRTVHEHGIPDGIFELMQLCKAICLYWLARRIIHVDVNVTSRALLRESHNFFLREDPMGL